jgi:hypothetical protein
MTLTRREKVLAGIVGVFFVGAAAYAGWSVVANPILDRRTVLTGMEQDLEKKRQDLDSALKARERMADLRNRSLPRDANVAKSEYQAWLLKLAEKHLRNHKVDVNAVGGTTRGKATRPTFNRFAFTVKGQASLGKVIALLHEFYSDGHLHQVHSLVLRPIQKSTDLDVTVEIQALSLPDAPIRDKLETIKPERPLPVDLATYNKEIADRKPFEPFTPEPVIVDKPPPPDPPKVVPFDPSKYAFITAIVREDDVPSVFVSCRTTGEKLRLRSGEKFKVGELAGTIGRIGDREVEIVLAGKSEPILRSVGDSLTKNDQPEQKPPEAGPGSADAKGKPPALAEKTAGPGPGSMGRDGGGPPRDFSKFGGGKTRGKRGMRGPGSGDSGPGNSGPGGPSRDGGDRNRKRE